MKRIMMIGLVMVVAVALYAASTATGDVASIGVGGANATQDYTLTISSGDVDSFTIGFSKSAVTDVNAEVEGHDGDVALAIAEGNDYGENNPENLHIFWQIVSTTKCSIALSATSMKEAGGDILGATIETTPVEAGSANGDSVSGSVGESDSETAKSLGTVYSFEPTEGKVFSAAGSQQVYIKTNSIASHVPDSAYRGTLTLTITADGEGN